MKGAEESVPGPLAAGEQLGRGPEAHEGLAGDGLEAPEAEETAQLALEARPDVEVRHRGRGELAPLEAETGASAVGHRREEQHRLFAAESARVCTIASTRTSNTGFYPVCYS